MKNSTIANVDFIDFSKIGNESKYVETFNFIKDHHEYYNHWTNVWSYKTTKDYFLRKLKDSYTTFSSLTFRNTELYLLLGEISHYLYNLEEESYFDKAVNNYISAIRSSPADYRCYWFLGNHFSQSNVLNDAIDNFLKAQKLLPFEQPSNFWNDFAYAYSCVNMPSHCIYAMDKVKSISGKEGSFEAQLGYTFYKKIVKVDKEKSYKKEDIWSVTDGGKITFTSRPLGIKILLDKQWDISITDYRNCLTTFIIKPTAIKSNEGKDINYTIALIIKAVNENDNLEDFIDHFINKFPDRNKISFSDKYEKIIAYEIKDKRMYQDFGTGHMFMVGVERSAPEYPGLLLENPIPFNEGEVGEVIYYTASGNQDRFKGKIFYAILLDSCLNISEKSLKVFKKLFDRQIIIE